MKKIRVVLIVLVVVIISICLGYKYTLVNSQWASTSTTESIEMNINTDDGDEDIDWEKYQSTVYTLSKSIMITEGGVYTLTGTISDGGITVDTESDVKLVLNNVKITNSQGPAIYIANARNTVIELSDNSENYLIDGTVYTGYDSEIAGTIFSHDDLTLMGNGSLEVVANNEDAIVGKDDLKIVSGFYKINSQDDGIRGKDSVYIQNGSFVITSLGDGIKSTNDTESDKGYIVVENGKFEINATLDGIVAQTKLLIKNGNFNITTGGGSKYTSVSNNWGNWGKESSDNVNSAKGLKSGDNLMIENGNFVFNTSDDAVHCNNYVGIRMGTLNISSGDDGIHADTELIIDGGTIDIMKSYEGLEAAKITINGGTINVVSSDDGINIAGGNDASATNRPGENNYTSNMNNVLTINGGSLYIDASGDGIDVNGSAYINGGMIQVDGPTNSGNGALDYDRIFEVNGGTLLAGGANGMLQSCSSSSSLYNVTMIFNTNYGSDDIIKILDSYGREVVTYQSNKTYSSLVVATSKLMKGTEYTIVVNNSEYETFTVNNITTTIGKSMMNYHDRPRR